MKRQVVTRLGYIAFTLLLGLGTAPAQEQTRINWLTFEQLSDSLAIRPKKVLISFHAEWCAYCRRMHQEIFTNPEVARTVNASYYAVKFDAESPDPVYFDGQMFINRHANGRRKGFHDIALLLGSRNGQFTVPVTLILDPDFKIIHRRFEYLDSKTLRRLL